MRRSRIPLLLGCAAAGLWLGCVSQVRHAPPPEGWTQRLASADAGGEASNFPMPPPEIERTLRERAMDVREFEHAGGGVMGALRIEAHFPESGRTLELKWKAAPPGGEGWNNTPRREIAAYEIQKWFLDPDEYVVPTTAARCIPVSEYRRVDPETEPNLSRGRCVLGALSLWLQDVEPIDLLLDEERFYRDARYARAVAHYNLLTYLVRNRDTRPGNQLASTDREAPRLYSIDNGITFGWELYDFFQPHWDEIRVPGLPRDAIERLRAVGDAELDALRVVAELREDPDGVLRAAEPSPPFEAELGARTSDDGVLQLGLEPGEIDALERRLRSLLDAVERGEIPLF